MTHSKTAARLSLAATGLALALAAGSASAATGLSIKDGGGFKNFLDPGDFGGFDGNAILVDAFAFPKELGSTFLYAQNRYDLSGADWALTYQFALPVKTSLVTSGGGITVVKVTDDSTGAGGSRTSEFRMFLDKTIDASTADSQTGDGFGDLNGATAAPGQVELARGTVTIVGGDFNLTNEGAADNDGDGSQDFLAENRDGSGDTDAVLSDDIEGSLSINIDFTSQNDTLVANDLTGAGLDLLVKTLGPLAPFDSGVDASLSVVGESTEEGGSTDFFGEYVDGNLDPTTPINDFGCGVSSDPCGGQYQIAGVLDFKSEVVPEPASLAITGLGLGLMALAGPALRRRRREEPAA